MVSMQTRYVSTCVIANNGSLGFAEAVEGVRGEDAGASASEDPQNTGGASSSWREDPPRGLSPVSLHRSASFFPLC